MAGEQVVVIRGDGSADWEATENRGLDVPHGRGLVVTCHMGSGETHFHPAGDGKGEGNPASTHPAAPQTLASAFTPPLCPPFRRLMEKLIFTRPDFLTMMPVAALAQGSTMALSCAEQSSSA